MRTAWLRLLPCRGLSCLQRQKPKPLNSVGVLYPALGWDDLEQTLVRTLLDYFGTIPDSTETQIKVLKDNIDWAKREKRIFLKHSLEIRLIGMQVISVLARRDGVIYEFHL